MHVKNLVTFEYSHAKFETNLKQIENIMENNSR